MPKLTVVQLDEARLATAYPLVRSATHVSPEQWSTFARAHLGEGGGAIAVSAGEDCLHGLAIFRETSSLRYGRSLLVEVIIAFELSMLGTVRKALCAALKGYARERGCSNLVYTLASRGHADPASPGRASWEQLGMQMETVAFVQQIKG